MRSRKQAAAEKARSNIFTATARKPFYVCASKTQERKTKVKRIRPRKIKKDPETIVVPWMRPQPPVHERRDALEKEDEVKRRLHSDISMVERFYAATLQDLEKVEDPEVKRAIKASVAMGEKEISILKKRLVHHRFDLRSSYLLKRYRKNEEIADKLVDKAQTAPTVLMGKLYLEHASKEYAKAGALGKSLKLQRFWASQEVPDKVAASERDSS